jgi:Pvc16 N-terminal domain
MIGNVLAHVSAELNAFICRHLGIGPENPKVVLSTIVNPDGSIAAREENVILVGLVDVRQESASPYVVQATYQTPDGLNYKSTASSLQVNLYVLFVSYFQGNMAKESLNYLTFVLRFFQTKSVFNHHNTPGLPPGVDKLEFTLETMDFQQKGYMWGLLGIKYMPFLLYKARLLSVIDNEPEFFTPPIVTTETEVQ